MSKAGPCLLRSAFVRAADTARKQDPQLARIYYLQMTERGATRLKACCVAASHLAERAWAVLNRGTPYVICDSNGNPVTPAQAKRYPSPSAGPSRRKVVNSQAGSPVLRADPRAGRCVSAHVLTGGGGRLVPVLNVWSSG